MGPAQVPDCSHSTERRNGHRASPLNQKLSPIGNCSHIKKLFCSTKTLWVFKPLLRAGSPAVEDQHRTGLVIFLEMFYLKLLCIVIFWNLACLLLNYHSFWFFLLNLFYVGICVHVSFCIFFFFPLSVSFISFWFVCWPDCLLGKENMGGEDMGWDGGGETMIRIHSREKKLFSIKNKRLVKIH